jgi:TolA-binding protein
MGLFRKKDKVIDLRMNYKPENKFAGISVKNKSDPEISAFGFMENLSSNDSGNSNSNYVNLSEDNSERKTKLAKRLLDITDKIEDLSNQIYHMKQRLEIIEKKLKIAYD